jgi:hypothetical protein
MIRALQPRPLIQSLNQSLILGLAVTSAALVTSLATISHGTPPSSKSTVAATVIVLLASVPPLWFAHLKPTSPLRLNGAARQLAVIGWRLGILLPSLALAFRFHEAERKCYLIALLACYFVALPLESWLLIQDVKRSTRLDT